MTDLLTRLSQAEAGTRELSNEILLALGWAMLGVAETSGRELWRSPGGLVTTKPPSPAESVDDCLALAPEQCEWWQLTSSSTACLLLPGAAFHGEADTPALALSIALLATLQEKNDG